MKTAADAAHHQQVTSQVSRRFRRPLTGCGDGVDVFSRTGSKHGRSVADTFASVYSLAYPEATLELLAAAEKLLGLTGDDVALCPRYGEGTAP